MDNVQWLTFVGGFRASSAESSNYWSPELYTHASGLITVPVNDYCGVAASLGVAYEPYDGNVSPRVGAGASCAYQPTENLTVNGKVNVGYGTTLGLGVDYTF